MRNSVFVDYILPTTSQLMYLIYSYQNLIFFQFEVGKLMNRIMKYRLRRKKCDHMIIQEVNICIKLQ